MRRGRNLALTVILAALLFVFAALPDILPIDGSRVLADPGGHHGGP
jgi:hypothetical protein